MITLTAEQAQQIEKALSCSCGILEAYSTTSITARQQLEENEKALPIIRAARAQEQEPVAWGRRGYAEDSAIIDCICPEEHDRCEGDYNIPLYTAPQPVNQEPDDLDWITPEAVFEAKLKLHGILNPPVKQDAFAAPVEPVKQRPVADVFKFLLGEGELEGCGFGDKPDNERGNFWWRKHLRKALEQTTAKDSLTAQDHAQEQAEQEPAMDYERLNALREGEQNRAEDAYFFVSPENNTPTLRKLFCQGFERGFHKGFKYAAPQPVSKEPVATDSAKKDAVFEASIQFIKTLTGMEPPPIDIAPIEVFAPFREFTEKVCKVFAAPPNVEQEQPVSQVPVGKVLLHEGDVNAKGYLYNPLPEGTDLYAAPVRTKDLTVSELDAIVEKHYDDEIDLKAMILDGIAADRRNNK